MKNLLILLVTVLSCMGCNKDDDQSSQDPVSQLPEATQTGRGIFACLVNGKPFIADNAYFNCYYQYVDGGYYFGIGGENENNYPQNLYLKSSNITLLENVNYLLEKSTDSSAYGGGGFVLDVNNYNTSYTNENFIGELTITKLDLQEYIVSGTFEMDLEDPFTGDTIKIREGRFDTLFTQ